ncbi:MAG: DsrE family protein [Pseudomonadota bacterium]
MKLLHALVLALTLAVTAPLVAQAQQAEGEPTVVINLTSDDVWTGQMALGFARNLQNAGANVVIFLNVRAVTLANGAVPQHVEAMTGKTAHQMLTEIVEAGGRVFVCPGCTRQAGLDVADRIDGIEPGGPDFLAIVMAPNTRIVSY